MTFAKKSFFNSPTGSFDICVRLYISEEGLEAETLLPLNSIRRLGAIDDSCSRMFLDDGSIVRVALSLSALHARLKTISGNADTIDLLLETSQENLSRATADTISAAFHRACRGTAGVDYIELRTYAQQSGINLGKYEGIDLILRYAPSDMRVEKLDDTRVNHTFIGFREDSSERCCFYIPVSVDQFKNMVTDAFNTKKIRIDLREETKKNYNFVQEKPVLKP